MTKYKKTATTEVLEKVNGPILLIYGKVEQQDLLNTFQTSTKKSLTLASLKIKK